MTDDTEPAKGSQYRHGDGTVEVVFAVEDERVLVVREYPTIDAFENAIADATDAGIHEQVADLPGVEAFADEAEDGSNDESNDENPCSDQGCANDDDRR